MLASQYPNVEDLAVVGIDLTLRGIDTKAVRKKIGARKEAAKSTKSPSGKTATKKGPARGRSKAPGMA